MIGSRPPHTAHRASAVLALLALGLALTACGGAGQGSESPKASSVPFVGSVRLDPDHGPAGTTVSIHGEGFASSAALTLAWSTYDGHWLVDGEMNENYMGRAYEPRQDPLGTVQTDAGGAFATSFTAPGGSGATPGRPAAAKAARGGWSSTTTPAPA